MSVFPIRPPSGVSRFGGENESARGSLDAITGLSGAFVVAGFFASVCIEAR
jgi:hypothetical protein